MKAGDGDPCGVKDTRVIVILKAMEMAYINEGSMGNKEEVLEANRADGLCTGIREKANKVDVV